MRGRLVSIKFCGGCNPRIDRARIAGEVRDNLTAYGCGVVFNRLEADVVVYLSGCTAGCACRSCDSHKPGVVVAANTVDAQPVDEAELGSLISQKARDCVEKLARPVPE